MRSSTASAPERLTHLLEKGAAHGRASVRLWRRSRRVAAALGGSRLQRMWLRVLPVALLWGAPLVGPGNRGLPLRFTFNGRTIGCVLGEASEYEILEEIFVDLAYGRELPARAETIVDLGSNIGLSALYFLARYPHARVLAVEPNPTLIGRLRRNLGTTEQVTIAPVAVADRHGEARLIVPSASWSGRLGPGPGHTVPTVTLDSLLREHGFAAVDVLKFDIEGAEFDVLAVSDLSRVHLLVGELHPEGPGQIQQLTGRLEDDFTVHTQPLASRWLLRARRRRSEAGAEGSSRTGSSRR
jgi:FkbM family methyltransferase